MVLHVAAGRGWPEPGPHRMVWGMEGDNGGSGGNGELIIPVALNYDRVLEDRSLIRELAVREGARRPGRWRQLNEVSNYVGWNLLRIVTRTAALQSRSTFERESG